MFATFLYCLASAQQQPDYYEAAYSMIDSLLFKQKLPASALKEVDKLYARAKTGKE